MSSNNVTPQMENAVTGAPTSPDIVVPAQSNLAQAVAAPALPAQTIDPNTIAQGMGKPQTTMPTPTFPESRLGRVLSAVANVAEIGMASVPARGRSSIVNGMTQGARGAQAQAANQQDIQFKNFDDQVRAAQLSNENQRMQMLTEDHQQKLDDAAIAKTTQMEQDFGIKYTFVPDDDNGKSVVAHFNAQQAQNGSVSVSPGIISTSKGWYVPNNDSVTVQQGLTKDYNQRAQFFGMNPTPNGQLVNNAAYHQLDLRSRGLDSQGLQLHADQIQGVIDTAKSELQRYQAGTNVDPDVVRNTQISIKNLTDEQASVAQRERNAIEKPPMTPQQKATLAKTQAETKALGNKPGNDVTELNSVAFDPNYQNPDGSMGGNVVMSKADAAAKGLQHYKVNPTDVNSLAGSFNDVQNKLNSLAAVTMDAQKMSQVQPSTAAAIISHGKAVSLNFGAHGGNASGGIGIDPSRVNAWFDTAAAKDANQATRDYVTAVLGAHEAITQLPRLQTFGKSSRMTQQQMEAAQNLLPNATDGAALARQKMVALQGMLDPLRKQVPHMPGADLTPTWLEQQPKQQPTFSRAGANSMLGTIVSGQ